MHFVLAIAQPAQPFVSIPFFSPECALISSPHFFHASPQRPSRTLTPSFMHFVLAIAQLAQPFVSISFFSPECALTSSPHFSHAAPQRPSRTLTPSLMHFTLAIAHLAQPPSFFSSSPAAHSFHSFLHLPSPHALHLGDRASR